MKPELLLIEPTMPRLAAVLDERYQVHLLSAAPDKDAFLAARAPFVRAVVTGGGTGVKAAVLDALPKVEIVSIFGVGLDAIDLEHAKRRGIRVTNTPDVLTDDVADLGIALWLAACRRLTEGDRFVRDGSWEARKGLALARKASGSRVGILGLGRIGRAIARRLEGFGCQIAYHDLQPIAGVPYRYAASPVELAASVDAFIVAAAGGAQSRRVVDRAVFDALGPQGLLVNISRGSCVDEPALVAALVEGRLGGAGLDVFEDEPTVPDALKSMDNVVLQPHRASATVETRNAMADLVAENLAAHFSGREPPTRVV